MQQIYLQYCAKTGDYEKCLEFAERFQNSNLPKLIPLLLGREDVLENAVWSFKVDTEKFLAAEIGKPENLKILRKTVMHHLQKLFPKSGFSFRPSKKKIRNRIEKAYNEWYGTWRNWAEEKGYEFIPSEYLVLASFLCLALYEECPDDLSELDHIQWLAERMKQIEEVRLQCWNRCNAFFKELCENAASYSREQPDPSELEKANAPFVKTYEDGECILFSKSLLLDYTDRKYGEGSAKIILDTARKRGILRHAKERDTLPYRYPKDKCEQGKSETVQIYAFIINKLNED